MARTLVMSAAIGLAGWASVNWIDGFVGVAVGAVASIGLLALLAPTLGVVPADDAHWAEDAFGGLVGRLARLCAAG